MRISGMLDYDARSLAALAEVREQAMAVFRGYGYARPPPRSDSW